MVCLSAGLPAPGLWVPPTTYECVTFSLSLSSLSLVLPLCVCRCRSWATGASAFECQRKPQRYNLDKRLLFKYVRWHPRRVLEYPHTSIPLHSHTHTHAHIEVCNQLVGGAFIERQAMCLSNCTRQYYSAQLHVKWFSHWVPAPGSRSGCEYGLRLWPALDWIGLCLAYCYLHRAWQTVRQDSRAVCSAHGEGKLIMHWQNV